jgi:hypothetical protein
MNYGSREAATEWIMCEHRKAFIQSDSKCFSGYIRRT